MGLSKKMKVNRTEYYTEVETDGYIFTVQNDKSQILIEKEEESIYIDVNPEELKCISDIILEVLKDK